MTEAYLQFLFFSEIVKIGHHVLCVNLKYAAKIQPRRKKDFELVMAKNNPHKKFSRNRSRQ